MRQNFERFPKLKISNIHYYSPHPQASTWAQKAISLVDHDFLFINPQWLLLFIFLSLLHFKMAFSHSSYRSTASTAMKEILGWGEQDSSGGMEWTLAGNHCLQGLNFYLFINNPYCLQHHSPRSATASHWNYLSEHINSRCSISTKSHSDWIFT